tara:strand:+ start:460 stop:1323 length:864 start_codon:yes stop_codon:yes gene_type:complete
MSLPIFIDNLNKDLTRYYCRVKIGNSLIPYTKVNRFNVPDSDDADYILMYNLATDKIDKIEKNKIRQYTLVSDNIVTNIKMETPFVEMCKQFYKQTKDKGLSDKFFTDNLLNEFIVKNNLLDVIVAFDFQLDAESIENNVLNKDNLDNIKKSFKKLLEIKIEENKKELDLLLKDCETEEDIEDIVTIKEMFDDCINEIQLDNIETLQDLFEQWPPILMPMPDSMDLLSEIEETICKDQTPLEEFQNIIDNIDDKELIKEFNEILLEQKDNIDEEFFTEIKTVLDEKL